MALRQDIRHVLELAEQCTLGADIPRKFKGTVAYLIAAEWVHMARVFAVLRGEKPMRPKWSKDGLECVSVPDKDALFPERPTVLMGADSSGIRDPKLRAQFENRVRTRLLLLPKGEEALTADRINVEPAEDIPLRERMLAALTKRQQLLMEHLWAKTTASFSVLQTIPNAWTSPDPSDDTVIKAIKRINTKLAENGLPVDLAIAGKRVNLNRPK